MTSPLISTDLVNNFIQKQKLIPDILYLDNIPSKYKEKFEICHFYISIKKLFLRYLQQLQNMAYFGSIFVYLFDLKIILMYLNLKQ